MCTPNFVMFQAIWTPLCPTLVKMHDRVSLLTNFLELKFYYRFGCTFDREACTLTFLTLRAIFTPFNPNLGEIAQRSFNFNQFLGIEI